LACNPTGSVSSLRDREVVDGNELFFAAGGGGFVRSELEISQFNDGLIFKKEGFFIKTSPR
jgi:hypothetical protein